MSSRNSFVFVQKWNTKQKDCLLKYKESRNILSCLKLKMMNNLFLIVLLCIFISCKKEALKSEVILKKEIVKPRVQPEGKPTNIDSAVVISSRNKVLKDFYSSTNYRTVWQSEKKRKIILAELLKSSEEGLNPEDYNLKTLSDFEKRATTLDSLDIVKYDILLTFCLQKYISHLTNGRLNPRKLYKNWDLKKKLY